jgi:DNA-binding MarR family transcriptional regulator
MAVTVTAFSTDLRATWDEIARTHAAVAGRVQEALTAAGLPPLPWYELLLALEEADEDHLKMSELAERLILTRGGLTKLFDRLYKAGLVDRLTCPEDRRAVNAVLLPAGKRMLEEMRPVVDAELAHAFADRLSEEEARTVTSALARVRGAACSIGE